MATLDEQLLLHEGLHLKPYVDTVGKVTIGVGRNLTDVGLSLPEIGNLLADDIERARRLVQRFPWFNDLDMVRTKVLVDMAFNLGGRLLGFKLFLAAVGRGDYTVASTEMLNSAWARQVPTRAARLATMMRTGRDYDEV